jgi:uncharacterized protein (TIGR02996 family)
MLPGSWAKRFVRDLAGRLEADHALVLSPKQRQALWQTAHKFRAQLRKRGHWLAEMVEAHMAALDEGAGLTNPERGFQLALSFDPDDWTTRGIFADHLEDQGRDAEARGQRWQAAHQMRPVLCCGAILDGRPDIPERPEDRRGWCWVWPAESEDVGRAGLHHALWMAVVCEIKGGNPLAGLHWPTTRIAAETKLALALNKGEHHHGS